MATCRYCGKEMLTANGCNCKYVKANDGKYYKRIKVGEEGYKGQRCNDCGAKQGYYHHPGCDIEKCPICGRQSFICDCDITWTKTKT